MTQSRVAVSTRITSAPRWASWSVQNGPAHTHVKSATRMPASGAAPAIYPTSARASRPSSASTSAVCWPRHGAGVRSVHGVAPSHRNYIYFDKAWMEK